MKIQTLFILPLSFIARMSKILFTENLSTKRKIEFSYNLIKLQAEIFKAKINHKDSDKFNFYNFIISTPSFGLVRGGVQEIFTDLVYFCRLKKSNPVIFDVGANIGQSCLFFKKFYPRATIYAFEPDKETFGYLKKNISDNNLKNIFLLNFGLSNFEGESKFYTEGHGDGMATLIKSMKERETKEMMEKKVEIKRLSTFIKRNGIKHIDILKIDTEGSEGKIIEDLSELLGNIDIVLLEYHYNREIAKENSLKKIIEIFKKNNFQYKKIKSIISKSHITVWLHFKRVKE